LSPTPTMIMRSGCKNSFAADCTRPAVTPE
jgi:hypothetical protein